MRRLPFVIALATACTADEPLTPVRPLPESFVATAHDSSPVIWLHYDYMVKKGDDAHSHEPDPRSIQLVVDAFRAHGITLYIDPQHTRIPETLMILFDDVWLGCPWIDNPPTVSFAELKQRYFRPHGNVPWHYAIFGHYAGRTDCTAPEGVAYVNGYDFIVTQALYQETLPQVWLAHRPHIEGGVIMHELGHNLGLRHGGHETMDAKPNYFSLMNDLFVHGVLVGDRPGSTVPVAWVVDYSDRVMPPFDESHLDETIGLGGTPDDLHIAIVEPCSFRTRRIARVAAAAGPVDWNCDGVIERDVTQVVARAHLYNYDNESPYSPYLPHKYLGFDDWAYVSTVVNSPEYLSATRRHGRAAP